MTEARHRQATCGRGSLRGAAAVFFLAGLLGLGAARAEAPAQRAKPERPSLLLVTLDTTRADHLGCYGRRPSPTPVIDALAAEGTLFLEAVSPAPLTLPAHASVMTGLPPRLHGARDNAPDRLDAALPTLATVLAAEGYDTGAVVAAAVLDRSTGIARGFRQYDDLVRVGPREWFDWRERGASQVAAAVERMLERLEPPFLLWVHFYDPHLPFVAPEPWASRFADSPYDAEIAFADHALGEVLERTRKNTPKLLVAVAGDHGEALGEHGEKDHGVLLHHATTHVPLLLVGPGVPRGAKVARTVGLVDLAPSLLDLLDAPALGQATGRSLRPLMAAGGQASAGGGSARADGSEADPANGAPAGDAVYELEALHGARAYGWHPLRGVQRGRFKLVSGRDERLFDVVADPRETKSVLEAHPEQARSLRSAFERRFSDDRDAPPAAPPDAEAQEQLEKLRSLGYAAGAAGNAGPSAPDPHEAIAWLAELDEARRLIATGERERTREAIALLDALLERNPENRPARLTLVGALRGSGKLTRALSEAEEAVRRWPDDYLVQFHLAQVLATAASRPGAPDKPWTTRARKAFARCLELNPRFADGHLARIHFELEKSWFFAQLAVTEAILSGVADSDIYFIDGEMEAADGKPEQAAQSYKKALELVPSHAGALAGLAKLAYIDGKPEEAVRLYSELMSVHPNASVARTLGAIFWIDLHDAERAREALERSLELEPRGADAREVRSMLREIARDAANKP